MQKTSISKYDISNPEKRGNVTVSVVGCNRAGLATACLLADAGFKVFCIDLDRSVIDHVKRGKLPFNEPELDSLLKKTVNEGRLLATSDIKKTVSSSDVILLFMSSRIDQKKRPDYSNVEKICKNIGLSLQPEALIILNSSLAPGTTETLIKEVLETASGLRAGIDFGLAYCSIRLTPGTGLGDIVENPKIFGAMDERSSELTRALLSTITKKEVIELSSVKTAEAVRLFKSMYQEANIALANELAHFCEEAGIDFLEVQRAINLNLHGYLPLPGAVDEQTSEDSYFLIEEAENLKTRLRMAKLAKKVNDNFMNQIFHLIRDAVRSCGKPIRRSTVLVLGITCQPNVKEIKGSYVKGLVKFLQNKGVTVRVYDPLFSYKELTELGYPVERTFTKALKGADCVLIAIGHDKFKRLNLQRMKHLMKKPSAIVDLSYVIDPVEAEERGFIYRGLGRGVWTRWKS